MRKLLLPAAILMNFLLTCAASAQTVATGATGKCTWTVTGTSDSLTLTISGVGVMGSYDWRGGPWDSYRNGIKTLTIEQGVTSIGSYTFADYSGLTSVTIPTSVKIIGDDAFRVCTGLTSVIIPVGVTTIGMGAFAHCSGLTGALTIPNSVTSIGDDAFIDCSGLTGVLTIPNSVTSIGDDAFFDCPGLTSISIPSSITAIGNGAFAYCRGLNSINVDSANTRYTSENGVLFNKNKTTLMNYPAGKTGNAYTIPSSVTAIGNYAFAYCSGLTSVTIPTLVKTIGDNAFRVCSGLTSVIIPAGVTSIGSYAFSYCGGLTSMTNLSLIPQNINGGINNDVFAHVNKQTCTLRVPESVALAYANATGWKEFQLIQGIATVTLSFDAQGGTVTSGSMIVIRDSAVDVLPTPERTGYTFGGWYSEQNGEGTQYTADTVTSDITLYATWTGNPYTLYFFPQGGTLSDTSKTVICGDTIGTLPTPLRTGYTFGSWYTGTNGGGTRYVDTTTYRIAGSTTLYAKWTANRYTVAFNAQGDTVSPDSIIATYGEVVGDLPAPTRTGYTFESWNTEPNGEGTRYTKNTKYTVAGNITLYATWIGKRYTLFFEAEGGWVYLRNKTVTYGEAVGELPVPEYDGYTFGGWYTEYNGRGVQYAADTVYSVTSDTRLYAKWTEEKKEESTTSVEDLLQTTVALYPNPFASEVHLTGAEGCTLTVVTAAGAVVHTQKVNSASEAIALGNLPSGVYFFRLEREGKRAVKLGIKY